MHMYSCLHFKAALSLHLHPFAYRAMSKLNMTTHCALCYHTARCLASYHLSCQPSVPFSDHMLWLVSISRAQNGAMLPLLSLRDKSACKDVNAWLQSSNHCHRWLCILSHLRHGYMLFPSPQPLFPFDFPILSPVGTENDLPFGIAARLHGDPSWSALFTVEPS